MSDTPSGVNAQGERPDAGPVVETVIGGRDIGVTLLFAGPEPDGWRLEDAATRLRDAGIDVRTELAAGKTPFDALIGTAPGHDVVIMGERAPSLRPLLFGGDPERVASASVGPVLVVRYDEALDG